MADDVKKREKYNLDLLRGWQRSQLKLLKEFATNQLLNSARLSGASGLRPGTHEFGGKLTALTRAKLIVKAGKDEQGQMIWQLNEDEVDRQKLLDFLKRIDVASGLDRDTE